MFWHGCNYPWSTDGTSIYYGMDFGANVWGSHLGVSTRRDAVAGDFERMARLGFRVARWFVFCDGRAGIVYDDRGLPAGPDPHLFADLDAALEIARGAGIGLDPVGEPGAEQAQFGGDGGKARLQPLAAERRQGREALEDDHVRGFPWLTSDLL